MPKRTARLSQKQVNDRRQAKARARKRKQRAKAPQEEVKKVFFRLRERVVAPKTPCHVGVAHNALSQRKKRLLTSS